MEGRSVCVGGVLGGGGGGGENMRLINQTLPQIVTPSLRTLSQTKAIDRLEDILNTGLKKEGSMFSPKEYVQTYTTCYNMASGGVVGTAVVEGGVDAKGAPGALGALGSEG